MRTAIIGLGVTGLSCLRHLYGTDELVVIRIFRMAPIHHHFELKGWPEPRVIVRFWIVTLVLVLIGLSTLKLR